MMKWDYGYAGTDSEERVDACQELAVTPEELEKMDEDKVREELFQGCWEMAIQQVDVGVEPCT
jgi:hypothetical protein